MNCSNNKQPFTLVIKDRGTGKSTQLLYTSELTQYPIIVHDKAQVKFLMEKAADLGLIIPTPMTLQDCRNNRQRIVESMLDNVLIDEGYNLIGEALDAYLGTHVVAVTLSDKLKEKASMRRRNKNE